MGVDIANIQIIYCDALNDRLAGVVGTENLFTVVLLMSKISEEQIQMPILRRLGKKILYKIPQVHLYMYTIVIVTILVCYFIRKIPSL